ncbi:hypothetical protein BGZ72_002010 [Mortierella alpina]|nr:hypothetical protein BGZ72_002010 [Mortierella alpina]
MSRMTIRTREAPMDWEREHDRNLPNIFSAPQPLDSEQTTKSHEPGPSFAFGSTSSDSNRLHKDASFSSQLSQSSLTSEGWGSTSLRPFRQDSQLSSSPSGESTPRQDSFSLTRHDSFSNPQSHSRSSEAPAETSSTTSGGMGGSTSSRLSQQRSREGRLFPASDTTDKKSSFDLGTLRNEVFDREQEQERLRSASRSPLGRNFGSSTSGRARIRSNLQYRSNTDPNGFWSGGEDDDEEEDDRAGHHDAGEDSDEYDHRLRTLSRNKSWSPNNDFHTTRTLQEQDFLSRTRRFQPQSHQRQKHGRVWSENVDLPFILSGYVQVAMNAIFAMIMVYIAASFIIGIQSEVSMNANVVLNEEHKRRKDCTQQWRSFNCDNLVDAAVNKLLLCAKAQDCLESIANTPGRASVAAKTFGLIVDSFVHAISFKTMAFVIVVLFGGLYVSNNTLSSYRNSYIMHHQNDVPPPTSLTSTSSSSSATSRNNMDRTKRKDAALNHTSLPASRERYRINGREASFTSGSSQFQGGNASHSRALIPQQPGVLQGTHDSDSDHDMHM